MKNMILLYLDNPAQLEKLYRKDKTAFARAFRSIYPEVSHNMLIEYWNERLNYGGGDIRGTRKDIALVLLGALIAAIIAKLPAIFSISEEYFYPRNIGFIIFPLLTAYFAWKNKLSFAKIGFIVGATLAGLIFINLFPGNSQSDTLILSCIHLVLFLWVIFGFAFAGGMENKADKRLGFLKYNGDLVVMTTLILIAGMIMSGMTIWLFSMIGLNIEKFYRENIGIVGLAIAPVIGTYLTQINPQLVSRISPVIAKIFSPLVLIMLSVYLVAILYSGKDPYNDRQFLMIFNLLLIGVMAIIFFSIVETTDTPGSRGTIWILFLLSMVTIIVNGIALSAILFRISAGGITPNRAAVLGGNILILINLLLVTVQLSRILLKKNDISGVRNAISSYLPVYGLWAAIVTFLFPLLFGFK